MMRLVGRGHMRRGSHASIKRRPSARGHRGDTEIAKATKAGANGVTPGDPGILSNSRGPRIQLTRIAPVRLWERREGQ